MSIESIKQKLAASAIKDTSWQEKAKWRQENKSWLDISFAIAIRIGSALDANKNAKISPKNQIELAEQLNCTPQYVNKLLKGQENFQIETICKIEKVLGISLIQVPNYEISQKVEVMSTAECLLV
jgi:plasmid maintenance system antidote protein VapI